MDLKITCTQVIFYWTLVARHICRVFDHQPELRPPILERTKAREKHNISLSVLQTAQIEEIFNLFDTDGGGSIDRSELELALVALGFQRKMKSRKDRKGKATTEMIQSIAADGTVTLDEFTSLMMGEINGRDPMDNVEAVFTILSKSDGNRDADGLITVAKLNAACKEFEVWSRPPLVLHVVRASRRRN